MANVANTAATGPAARDTVSGGKMLGKLKASQDGFKSLGNSPEGARATIMGLKFSSVVKETSGTPATKLTSRPGK